MVEGEQLAGALRWALIEAAAKRDLRARLFPTGAACACGVSNPQLLILGRGPARCYECGLRERGLAPVEQHHIGGRSGGMVVPLPANHHRLHDLCYQDLLERLPLPAERRLQLELVCFVVLECCLLVYGPERW